jgi:hypothetical protein
MSPATPLTKSVMRSPASERSLKSKTSRPVQPVDAGATSQGVVAGSTCQRICAAHTEEGSLPAPPSIRLLPMLPSMRLPRALPVPLLLAVHVSSRFSTSTGVASVT